MPPFKAYLIDETNGKPQGRFVTMEKSMLDAGEVCIRVAYSSVNYKDALAGTGAGKIVRRLPCVGGIDLSGIVESSSDARFRAGDPVLVTGFDLGIAHHGGYATLARVPADWVIALPENLSLFEAMALGTAGFTAALAIVRMEENGMRPEDGPILVSGATGGVGSLAVDMLAGLGYQVTALTGKESATEYLKRLGAKEILLRSSIDLSNIRPLGKALWGGAIDSLGGDMLAWIASTTQPKGSIASIGMAMDAALKTSVMPFILRGINLLGIDSVYARPNHRQTVWQRLGHDLRPRHLPLLAHKIAFAELPSAFDAFLKGQSHGRVVVAIDESGQNNSAFTR